MTTLKEIRLQLIQSNQSYSSSSIISDEDILDLDRSEESVRKLQKERHVIVLHDNIDVSIAWKHSDEYVQYNKEENSYPYLADVDGQLAGVARVEVRWQERTVEAFELVMPLESPMYLPKPLSGTDLYGKTRYFTHDHHINIAQIIDRAVFGSRQTDPKVSQSFYGVCNQMINLEGERVFIRETVVEHPSKYRSPSKDF